MFPKSFHLSSFQSYFSLSLMMFLPFFSFFPWSSSCSSTVSCCSTISITTMLSGVPLSLVYVLIINETTDSQEIVWIVLCFGKQFQFEVLNSKEIICIKADRHHCIVNSSTMMLKGLTALILISSLCAKHYLVKTEDKNKSKFFKGFYSKIFWKI